MEQVKLDPIVRTTLPQRGFTDAETLLRWHNRLGHHNLQYILNADRLQLVSGVVIPRSMHGTKAVLQLPKCSSCQLTKQHRHSFKGAAPTKAPVLAGEVMCGDLHIFVNCPAYNGTTVRANFTDPVSQKTLSYSLKSKDELVGCLARVRSEYHDVYDVQPWKILQYDGETVLTSKEAVAWFNENKVQLISSPTDTPEMNGVAEEVNEWLGDTVTTMLHYSGRPVEFGTWRMIMRCT